MNTNNFLCTSQLESPFLQLTLASNSPFIDIISHYFHLVNNQNLRVLSQISVSCYHFSLIIKKNWENKNFSDCKNFLYFEKNEIVDLTGFNFCKNILEVEIVRIKKFVEMMFYVGSLENSIKKDLIILSKEKPCPKMLMPGLERTHKQIIKTKDLELNSYDYIGHRDLSQKERTLLICDVFRNHVCFDKQSILDEVELLVSNIDLTEIEKPLKTYFKYEIKNYLANKDLEKAEILKTVCDTYFLFQGIYEEAEDENFRDEVDFCLTQHDYKTANCITNKIHNEIKKDQSFKKILVNQVRWDISKNKFLAAEGLMKKLPLEEQKELSREVTAKRVDWSLSNQEYEYAFSLAKNDHLELAKIGKAAIKDNQQAIAVRALNLMISYESKKEDFFEIEKTGIRKILSVIFNKCLTNSLNPIKLMASILFPEYDQLDKWLEFAASIKSYSKKQKFLEDFFEICQIQKAKNFIKNADMHYTSFVEPIERAAFIKLVHVINALSGQRKRKFVLQFVIHYLFQFVNKIKSEEEKIVFVKGFMQAVHLIKADIFLEDITSKLITFTDGNITSALDIANMIKDPSTRLNLFIILIKEAQTHNGEIFHGLLEVANSIENTIKRRECLREAINL